MSTQLDEMALSLWKDFVFSGKRRTGSSTLVSSWKAADVTTRLQAIAKQCNVGIEKAAESFVQNLQKGGNLIGVQIAAAIKECGYDVPESLIYQQS